MATPSANSARIAQTRTALERARKQMLEEWLARRRNRDAMAQHKSQFDTLETVLKSGLGALCEALGSVSSDGAPGPIYSRCRELELRLAWLQRVWWYFRRKFDQRDDPDLGPVLAAADEAVWCCYTEAFVRSGRARRTAPLAYFEPLFSPETVPRDDPPPELETIDSVFLKQFLAELPVPLIALPPACVAEPWWLALVAHEAGHQVQHDLELVGPFAEMLRALVCPDPDERPVDPEANRWGGYGQEIFADLYSVSCLGASAVRSMVELEMAEPADMALPRRGRYPAPLVRLALLAAAANRLGAAGDDALAYGLGESIARLRSAGGGLASDLARVKQVAESGLDALLGRLDVPVTELAGWQTDPHQDGTLESWAGKLSAGDNVAPPRVRASSRLLLAASVKAWEGLSVLDDVAREEAYKTLAGTLLDNLARSREPGTRGPHEAVAVPEPLAARFTDWLLHTPVERFRL